MDLQTRDVSIVETAERCLKIFEMGMYVRVIYSVGVRIFNGDNIWIIGSVVVHGN